MFQSRVFLVYTLEPYVLVAKFHDASLCEFVGEWHGYNRMEAAGHMNAMARKNFGSSFLLPFE